MIQIRMDKKYISLLLLFFYWIMFSVFFDIVTRLNAIGAANLRTIRLTDTQIPIFQQMKHNKSILQNMNSET